MRTLVLVALASAVVGGATGAAITLYAVSGSPKHPAKNTSAPATESTAAADDRPLEDRLAAVEDAVRALENRRSPLAGLTGPSDAGLAPGRPGAPPAEAPSLVDDPVFEAAVRDVIERADIDRDSQREQRRDDRRQQEVTRWMDDMTPRLGLNEQQKKKLLGIAQDYMNGTSKIFQGDGGPPPPREERRAQVQKLREQADQKIRAALDPNQARTFDALPEEDRLGFTRRGFSFLRRDPGTPSR